MPIAMAIDHLILAVQDLKAATATFAGPLGLHVSGGGVHPQFGTINRIIVLGDDYIELLAAGPGAAPRGWIGAMLSSGAEGCAGFALATSDPSVAADTLRARGLTVEGPNPGRLAAEGGFSRGWQVVRFSDPANPSCSTDAGLPFLIRHDSAGQERGRLLAGPGGLAPHPLGAQRVACVTVAVEDLDSACATYGRCYDLRESAVRSEDTMLAARTATLTLPSGAEILLAAPGHASHGPVAKALTERGAGLFAFTLAVDDLPAAVHAVRGRGLGVRVDEPEDLLVAAQINHRQTHGARIGLVAAH